MFLDIEGPEVTDCYLRLPDVRIQRDIGPQEQERAYNFGQAKRLTDVCACRVDDAQEEERQRDNPADPSFIELFERRSFDEQYVCHQQAGQDKKQVNAQPPQIHALDIGEMLRKDRNDRQPAPAVEVFNLAEWSIKQAVSSALTAPS